MVTTVNTMATHQKPAASDLIPQTLPRIVELVGPAGSGKTTISRALCQQENRPALMGLDIELRRPSDVPTFLRTLPTLLPLLIDRKNWQRANGNRHYSWDEIKALAYATGWHHVFESQATENDRLILLDHGPVFRLARLYTYGPPQLHEKSAQPWWDKMLQQWGSTLDMVIWLDAPNQILEERIKNRNQRHVLKDKSGEDVDSFLDKYRHTYQQILDRLMTEHGLRVVRFDTSKTTLDQVIHEVQQLCASPIGGQKVEK